MKWNDLAQESCSVAKSVSVLGDRWTLLVLRDCFRRAHRFEEFQARLNISRTIIANRLSLLVDEGVLEKRPYQSNPVRYEYHLTDKGLALHPVLMAIMHWGDSYYQNETGSPLIYKHKACGCDFTPVLSCSECGDAVGAKMVETRRRNAPAD